MGRGSERSVNCAKCGRRIRKDKAVFIEKAMMQNPVERKDVYDDQYTSVWRREVAYCPSCGKHMRVYEKKIQQLESQKEREERSQFSRFRPRPPQQYYPQQTTEQKPVEKKTEVPKEESEIPAERKDESGAQQ